MSHKAVKIHSAGCDGNPDTGTVAAMSNLPFNGVAGRIAADTPDVPSVLRPTFLVLALHARDEQGRGMYPSISTIGRILGRSYRQVMRDIHELEEQGFIVKGDQTLANRMAPGRRPFVWDLATAEPIEAPGKRAAKPKVKPKIEVLERYDAKQFKALCDAVDQGVGIPEEVFKGLTDLQVEIIADHLT